MTKLVIVSMIFVGSILLSSCKETGDRYRKAYEECMATLEKSEFDYSVRDNMCVEYGKTIMYRSGP
jgi:hypothetical protein